ncbi:uncharacterized protein [Dermacentor andersoni]|uniref:uncharacterized protein n=1 Tax=Dermacentor andersoni TaxID=34620 RepID=UPI00215577B4|nr:uncharacterized protein LOC126533272 [Dermacentor andersoni]
MKLFERCVLPRKACTRRHAFFLVFILPLWMALRVITTLAKMLRPTELFWSGYVVNMPGCTIPFYDPYHWTIKDSALQKADNYYNICAKTTRPNAVRQTLDVFTLDEKVLEVHYNASANDTVCYYQLVLRNMTALNSDADRVLGPRVRVVFGRPLRQEYIMITCEANGAHLFSEYFLVPVDKRDAGKALSPGQLNVLIVGLDATSRLNFNRRMSRTRRFLVDERGAYEFLMYNKVGLNSVPNVMPLLTGVSGEDVTRLFRGSYYDSVPAIWKVYKSLGYATMYLEEMPNWATFTGTHGFKEAPTDYYAHHMMLQMHYNTSDDRWCMGSRLKTKEVLRYVGDILKFHKGRKLFAFVWLAEISHDDVQQVAFMDAPMEQFFRDLSASGVMDSTAVLFLSDHGMRKGTFRMTEIGRHEDNMPFGLFVFPRRFLSDHPEAAVFLEINQRRLVTAYDFHATLLSLPALLGLRAQPSTTGLTLFRQVPPERTCDDAFIPQPFCACLGATENLDDASLGQSFAVFAIAHLNALAEMHFPGKCATWRLDKVDEASIFGGNVTDKTLIRVSLKTLPEAHFDVYGGIPKASSLEYHVDIIDRTDIYVNKTACLKWSSWQRVCNCKDQA